MLGLFRYAQHVYVITDGLDECPRQQAQNLEFVRNLHALECRQLRLLLTSRDERDIREAITSIPDAIIGSLDTAANNDIPLWLTELLDTDDKLKAWPIGIKDNIRQVLIKRAGGLFRWVQLDLENLRLCETVESLELALDTLPDGMDKTYDRILTAIPACHQDDAERILQFLVFSQQPLTLSELAEIVTVNIDINSMPRILEKPQFWNIQDVMTLLSDLISTKITERDYSGFSHSSECIVLAHFSVKEYLVSNIFRSFVPRFAFNPQAAHTLITRTCLNYLLHFEKRHLLDFQKQERGLRERVQRKSQPALYSACFWMDHCSTAAACTDSGTVPDVLLGLLLLFLQPYSVPYVTMTLLRGDMELEYIPPPPLCLVIEAGCLSVAAVLVENAADVNAGTDSALFLASRQGHASLARLLLNHGASVDMRSSSGQTALQVAVSRGDVIIVELLISKGADPNARQPEHTTALQEASRFRHEAIVRLLLENGADVNAKPASVLSYCGSGTALQEACSQGDGDIVELLLNWKADVNAQWHGGMTALGRAVESQNEHIMLLLLKNGADVNAVSGQALVQAVWSGNDHIVLLLLKNGADVNAANGMALERAVQSRNEHIVLLLLRNGAHVNTVSALRTAVRTRNEALIRLLLENGADARDGLGVASRYGYLDLVLLLLENGADVNYAPEGGDGNALQCAVRAGKKAVVLKLLEAGAGVNAVVSERGSALREAIWNGHEALMQILLEHGADVNMKGRDDLTPLQDAVAGMTEELVRLLLKYGADVNAKGGNNWTALRVARAKLNRETKRAEWVAYFDSNVERLEKIVQLVLEHGAVEQEDELGSEPEQDVDILRTISLVEPARWDDLWNDWARGDDLGDNGTGFNKWTRWDN